SRGLTGSVGFVFDWYVLIVRLDSSYHLSWILFGSGLGILLGCAVWCALRTPVRERSLGSVFFNPELPARFGGRVLRTLGIWLLFSVFFFSVFNRLIEWLAIAVDSALFVLTVVVLLALTLSMIAHHRGHRTRRLW